MKKQERSLESNNLTKHLFLRKLFTERCRKRQFLLAPNGKVVLYFPST